jgi:hypothetical protein
MPGKTVASNNESRPYTRFLEYIRERAVVDQNEFDPEEIGAKQIDRITSAETEEDLFSAMETEGLAALQDLPSGTVFTINGYRLLSGQLGVGVWAVMDCTNEEGQDMPLNTGVTRVLAFLRMCEVMGKFPIEVRVMKKTTASGNELVTLARPVKRAVKSTAE